MIDDKDKRIVRMNCLTNAVKFWEGLEEAKVEQILEVAKQFEKYVLEG